MTISEEHVFVDAAPFLYLLQACPCKLIDVSDVSTLQMLSLSIFRCSRKSIVRKQCLTMVVVMEDARSVVEIPGYHAADLNFDYAEVRHVRDWMAK